MKGKRIVSSLLVSLFVVGLFVAFGDHAAQAATASFSSVRRLSDSSVVANATSSIIREAESVTVTQITTGLDPGAAHSLWFLIFNDPSKCANTPCSPAKGDKPDSVLYSGTGQVADKNGNASFAAQLKVGDTSGALRGPGLLNPMGAEVHLDLRSHGPAIPDMLEAQLNTVNGGCPPNKCVDFQGVPHIPFTDDTTQRLAELQRVLNRVGRFLGVLPQ